MDTEKVNDCINTLLFNKGELKLQEAKDIIDVLHHCVKEQLVYQSRKEHARQTMVMCKRVKDYDYHTLMTRLLDDKTELEKYCMMYNGGKPCNSEYTDNLKYRIQLLTWRKKELERKWWFW